jgi:hypothetical protein
MDVHEGDVTRPAAPRSGRAGRAAKVAGGLMAVVGLVNAALGALSSTTDVIQLSPAASGGLIVAGLLLGSAGALVWRGSRLALALSLTVLGILLAVQVGDAVVDDGSDALPRLIVLAVLVASLGMAQLQRLRQPAG